LVFSLKLHQNFPIIALISLVKVFGSQKTLIVHVGIACITAFNGISFPACIRNFSFHPLSLAHILPLI